MSVHGMGNQEKCQTTILHRSFPLLPLSFRLSFVSISFIHPLHFLSLAIFRLSGCFVKHTITHIHTRTHTPLGLNQKSMLSMASQYLIKQLPCPSWQVMHFIVLTHTHTHSDSLSHMPHIVITCGNVALSFFHKLRWNMVTQPPRRNDDRLCVYVCIYI